MQCDHCIYTAAVRTFVQNTGNLGFDFVFDGITLKLIVRYKQVFGHDNELQDVHGIDIFIEEHRVVGSTVELCHVHVNTMFETDEGILLCIMEVNNGMCSCTTVWGAAQNYVFDLQYIADHAEIYRNTFINN